MPSSLGGLSSFTRAFVGPAIQQSFAMTQQYAAARYGPPPPPMLEPAPPDPDQYLPPPGPYSTGGTWSDTFGTLGSMVEMTALFMGLGAALGLAAGLCIGNGRKKVETDEEVVPTNESDLDGSQSSSSQPITDFSAWADKHFEPELQDTEFQDDIK